MKPLCKVGCGVLVSALMLGPGCGTTPKASRTDTATRAVEEIDRAEAHARFAAGISHELNDEHELAFEQFHLAALADPTNEPIVIEVARRLIQRGENDKAIEILLTSARHPGVSGEIHNWLARVHLVNGSIPPALAASRTAIEKSPGSLAGYQNLAEVHLQNNQPKKALAALDQAAQFKEADATFLVNLAGLVANYMRHHPGDEEAGAAKILGLLNRAEALEPDNPNLLHKLADSFLSMGQTTKAAEIYANLVGQFPESSLLRALVREKLANLFLQAGEKERAAAELEAMVRENPASFPQAYYALGSLAYDDQDFARAAEHFASAIALNPDLEHVYYDLAGAQLNLRRIDDAARTLDRARAKFPKTFVGEFLSGLAQSQLKNYPAAIRHFTDAEVIARTDAPERLDHTFHFQMGAAFERNHDYEMAARCFETALELSPDFAEALNYLGYMWADLGMNLARAKTLIGRALEIDPDNAAYLDSMGWVWFRLDEPERALPYLERAADLIEEADPVIYDHLGDVYKALGRVDDAREMWNKALALEDNDGIQSKVDSLETTSTP